LFKGGFRDPCDLVRQKSAATHQIAKSLHQLGISGGRLIMAGGFPWPAGAKSKKSLEMANQVSG